MSRTNAAQPGRSLRVVLIWTMLLALFGTGGPSPAWTAEPNPGYRDDTPPTDQLELDALRERSLETRKRLQRPETELGPPTRPTDPFPLPPEDERDDAPPIRLEAITELQQAIDEMRAHHPEEAPPSEAQSPGPASGPPPGATSPGASDEPPLKEEIQGLSDRLAALERAIVGTEDRPGLAGLIGGWSRTNGFFLSSANGNFFLRFPVLLQADLRTFPDGQCGSCPGVRPTTFILQRIRPAVSFRLWRYFSGFMNPDFGNGFIQNPQPRVQIADGFGEFDYFPAARLRIGQFKSPIGLEMLQGVQNLSFMERSLARNLLPNRDIGAMLWGVIRQGLVEYELGAFNGAPNANFYQGTDATSNSKTLEARLFLRPFATGTTEWLRGLGAGVGMSWGNVFNSAGQDPMQTETFSYTFFQYRPGVLSDGARTRVVPQLAWYWWRVGMMAQYVSSNQHLSPAGAGPSVGSTHRAWSVQLSWLLSNDTATFGRLEPKRPLDIAKGQWGAWELAVRYADLHLDQIVFTSNLADPSTSVRRAQSTTAGLNWYLNPYVRISGNFVYSAFTGATSAYRAANHETALMFRTQLAF